MESFYRNKPVSDVNKNDLTIIPIICKLKEDFQNLFDYEKDWEYVWELL
jgi:hypothetical protein